MQNETSKKKIIIIGAGISGLASGIYGQKNDFDTEIYEKNPVPGGLCVSWNRKGYWIDGCIHWMTGTKEGTQLNEMWHDVDAFDQEDIIHPDNFGTIECDGVPIVLWTNISKLEEELIAISPEDEKQIHKFGDLIISLQNLPLPLDLPISNMSFGKLIKVGLRMIPYLPDLIYASITSPEKYAKKFKSPIIRKAICNIIKGDSNLHNKLYAYGTVCVGNGGVPKNGSDYMTRRIVNKYKSLGGKLHLNRTVKEIIIENKKAIGVLLENGDFVKADYVIASCDTRETLEHLLKSHYFDHGLFKRYKKPHIYPAPSCVYASYIVDAEAMKALNISETYEFDTEEFLVGNTMQNCIKIRDYSYDEKFIKNGKTVINVLVHQTDYDYRHWEFLYKNKEEYNKEKESLANVIAKKICEKFPTLESSIECIDVATPATFNRYTNAYHGAYMPFACTPKGQMLMHNGKIRGLKNFYVSGQWTQMPGGLPIALSSGKFAIQRILKKEHLFYKFTHDIYVKYTKKATK